MDNETRINIYGDSIMRGTVIDSECRYHATVSNILGRLSNIFDLAFRSRAFFGSTITRGHAVLQKDLDRGLDCDYAVVEYGGNDCSFDWEAVAARPNDEHLPFTSIEDFTKNYTEMVGQLQEAGVEPVLMTLPPLDAERHLHFIGKTEEARQGILHWLGDAHMIYRFHEMYSHAVEAVARSTGALLVDVRSRFLDRHDLKELVGMDGVHLSPSGYRLIGEVFEDFLKSRRGAPALARA